jgi:thioredoxin 1
MIELNDKNFDELFAEKKPLFVFFWADWCTICLDLLTLFEEMEKEAAVAEKPGLSSVVFAKIDNEKNLALSEKFSIEAVPTVIAFADGKICDVKTGLREKAEYGEMIIRLVN